MDISFVMAEHKIGRRGQMVCEVWDGSRLVGVVYPHEDGIHVVSKYLNGTQPTSNFPPGVLVKLNSDRRGRSEPLA